MMACENLPIKEGVAMLFLVYLESHSFTAKNEHFVRLGLTEQPIITRMTFLSGVVLRLRQHFFSQALMLPDPSLSSPGFIY